jgi:hypothetical protein
MGGMGPMGAMGPMPVAAGRGADGHLSWLFLWRDYHAFVFYFDVHMGVQGFYPYTYLITYIYIYI